MTTKTNFHDLDTDLTAEEVSFYLQSVRESLGLSKKEFSEKIGVVTRTYYSFEEGRNIPKNWITLKKRISILVREHKKQN